MNFEKFLIKESQLYRKRHYLKKKLDEKLEYNDDLQVLFGIKEPEMKVKLNKMTLLQIKKNIINQNKNLYRGYSKFKKDELIEFILTKSNDRKGGFDYSLLIKDLNDEVLKLKNKDIDIFLDICSAPGEYSKYLSETYKIKGVGVTLPIENGGINFDYKLKNYEIVYLDIIKNINKIIKKDKFPFIVSGCLDMTVGKKEKFNNINLWLSTFLFTLNNLQKNGIFAFKISLRYIKFAANIIYIFTKIFKIVKTFKSLDAIGFRSMFYIVGFGYKIDIEYLKLINKLLLDIKKKNFENIQQFRDKTFFSNKKYFIMIKKMLENIFQIQINAIENII